MCALGVAVLALAAVIAGAGMLSGAVAGAGGAGAAVDAGGRTAVVSPAVGDAAVSSAGTTISTGTTTSAIPTSFATPTTSATPTSFATPTTSATPTTPATRTTPTTTAARTTPTTSPTSTTPTTTSATSARSLTAAASSDSTPSSAGSAQAAAPTPSGTPSDTTSPTSPPPTATAPSIDPLPSGLVTAFPLAVSGSGTPGDVVRVSAGGAATAASRCEAAVDEDGKWDCSLQRLPDGPNVPVRAESAGSGLADTVRVDVLSPPVISAPGGTLTTGGGIRGTAYPGAAVTVTAETGASCTFTADSTGAWGCVLTGSLADGRHTVTATQVAPFSDESSAASAAVTIVLDTAAPPAPVLQRPAPGSSVRAGEQTAFGGKGESGDRVTVYASTSKGTTIACTATVAGGSWSCAGALPVGTYLVSALQRDEAGNVSAGSNSVALTVEAAAGTSAPPTSAPTPVPSPTEPASPGVPSSPSSPGPHHRGPTTPDWETTPFTTASAPVVSAEAFPGWLRSLALAVAALLLLALPARLLAGTIARGRALHAASDGEASRSRPSLFGRNRSRAELGETDALLGRPATEDGPARQPVWLAPAVVTLAATLVTLSSAVQDGGAYIRVLCAVAIAVVAVNAVWLLVARSLAAHLHLAEGEARPRTVVRPVLLLLVAATAIGSRLLGLEPALLFGIVVGFVLAEGAGRVRRGRLAAAQVSAIAALGVLAWLTVGALPPATGAVSAFFLELANALSLLGIGSAAVALLPIGGLAGRAIFQWSRLLWLGMSLVVYTLLFALLLPVASLVENGTSVLAIAIAALAFAALSVSVWLWERFVEPAR